MATEPRGETDYYALADDYAENPPTASEVISIEIDPTRLSIGRPSDKTTEGKTPALSVRFPRMIRNRLEERAKAESAPSAEVVRRAVVEYLDRHSA